MTGVKDFKKSLLYELVTGLPSYTLNNCFFSAETLSASRSYLFIIFFRSEICNLTIAPLNNKPNSFILKTLQYDHRNYTDVE